MALNKKFDDVVTGWETHCDSVAMSSNPADYEDPTAIEGIIQMGREAIPLIKAHLQTKPNSAILPSAWLKVVRTITGHESEIPEEIRGDMEGIRAHLIASLS